MIFVAMEKKKMKLIDADELKKALGITSEDCNKCGWGSYESCGRGYDFEDACVAIDNAVTVDAVPVERIEESKNWSSLIMNCIATLGKAI